jgi:hypothetical protein
MRNQTLKANSRRANASSRIAERAILHQKGPWGKTAGVWAIGGRKCATTGAEPGLRAMKRIQLTGLYGISCEIRKGGRQAAGQHHCGYRTYL